jgi:ABC-2 type transport system permease protein
MTTTTTNPGVRPAVGGLTRRNLVLYRRSPTAFAGAVLFPLVFFAGFSLVLWRMLDARGIDAGQYLPPAIVVQSMMLTAISSATLLAADAASGLLTRLRG